MLFRSLVVVFAVAIGLLACGSTQRQLTAMNITPAVADAKSFSNGQVPFAATGQYTMAPTSAPLQPALWNVYLPNGSQGGPTINSTGLAQCGSAAGTYEISAYALADPNIPNTNANLLNAKKAVLGTAQLICP